MNPNLTRLLDCINDRRARRSESVTLARSDLTAALQLISAPYALEAVACYSARFLTIVDARPEVLPADLGDIATLLSVLREVAGVREAYFAQSHLPIQSSAQLQPYTGDGPLCDVLMLDAYDRGDRPEFGRIAEWFVWLCLRYHRRLLAADTYANYLDGDGLPGNRLIHESGGSAIAAAGCEIRKLGDPDRGPARAALCALGLELSDIQGRHFALLAALVYGNRTIGVSEVMRCVRSTGLSEESARHELEDMRERVAGPIRHLLQVLWGQVREREPSTRRHLNAVTRHYLRPRVVRYGALTEEVVPSDPDENDGDVSVLVYATGPESEPKPKRRRGAWVDQGRDFDFPDGDAAYGIHAGKEGDNPIASYYQAKGYRYAMEYRNALLPWARTRLGSAALRVLVQALHHRGDGDRHLRAVKLIVFLSLVTGRPLGQVCGASIRLTGTCDPAAAAELVLSVPEHVLYVKAATPTLASARHACTREVLHTAGRYLAFELPTFAVELVGDGGWLGPPQLDVPGYVPAAVAWLKTLPAHWGISAAAVRDALALVLLAQNHGDLGLVKLLTDRQSLNFQNLIHYAAYPVTHANTVWARALTTLLEVGLRVRNPACSGADHAAYVGTPDALDVALLRAEFDRLRGRLRICLAGKDPDYGEAHDARTGPAGEVSRKPSVDPAIRAHNLLTLYTLLWLNLATASRARVSPAPVAMLGDVAVVADKHRADGSADRLVPLTRGVQAQLRAYFAYIWQLAFRQPQFQPLADAFAAGVLNFQFLSPTAEVIDYRPKWLYENECLIAMPGNWARKLVRQQMAGIGGRFLDAGMGHWVAGRHPYRVTSNFAFQEFRRVWLGGQAKLEQALGFTVIGYPGLERPPSVWPVPGRLKSPWRPRPSQPKPDATHPDALDGSSRDTAVGMPVAAESTGHGAEAVASEGAIDPARLGDGQGATQQSGVRSSGVASDESIAASPTPFDFEAECRAVDAPLYEALCAAAQEAVRPGHRQAAATRTRQTAKAGKNQNSKLAVGLVRALARRHGDAQPNIGAYVEACCAAARKLWHVAVFTIPPRYQFQHDWLLDELALYNLAYFTARVLPVFEAELAHLPPAADPACADAIDIGRLAMLCIWRQGLVTWPVLDAFLQSYYAHGVLATGELRYVPSALRCRRNGAQMERLTYLEPYCQVYLVSEHARLRQALHHWFEPEAPPATAPAPAPDPVQSEQPEARREHPEQQSEPSKKEGEQPKKKRRRDDPQLRRAMLQSALRTYLVRLGVIEPELRRIGNLLTLTLTAARQYHLLHSSPVLAAYASAEFETHDLPDAEIRHLAGYPERVSPRTAPSAVDRPAADSVEDTQRDWQDLPGSELGPNQDVVHRLAHRSSAYLQQLQRTFAETPVEGKIAQLLKAFGQWYLRVAIKADGAKVEPAARARFQRTIEVVGYALLGFGEATPEPSIIDEAFLQGLQEELRDHAPHMGLPGPFRDFRRFLRHPSNAETIAQLGFVLGDIEPTVRGVLAKVIKPSCIRAAAETIHRVDLSGLARHPTHVMARQHLEAVARYGMRRTEAEYLRDADVQGDVIRVQPYAVAGDKHTLKTKWSKRVLPLELARLAGLHWVQGHGSETGHRLLADADDTSVHGYSFYDAVNKLLQHAAADPGVHLHTVRHTVASQLLLSVLSDAVDYRCIEAQFPWLHEFLLPVRDVEALLGGEGQSGHGLQAIAAMLGHSHPLTTLRHYIHTVGIAFYAHLCGLPCPDLLRAFEHRLASPRTMQRHSRDWRALTLGLPQRVAHAYVHPQLLAVAEELCPNVVDKREATLLPAPPTPELPATVLQPEAPGDAPAEITYERLAHVEEVLQGEVADGSLDAARIEHALARIFAIPSGKRGSGAAVMRHPCVEDHDRRLPQRLSARSPTQAAAKLCTWLEQLRRQDQGLFDWLLSRWLYASEQEFGRMRLDAGESAHWERLPKTRHVEPHQEQKVFKRRPGSGRADRVQHWGRIRCKDTDEKWIRKDVPAVRWVMTWVAALRMARVAGTEHPVDRSTV